MSRKQPEIKIIYPDASEAAMLLTEAMIKRSSGKRIVETTSEEKEYNGQELFGGALACKTDTSVELTLKLNPDVTDYALATLIARNLTEDEKRAIRMATTSMEVVDLLSTDHGTQAAAGASTCTDEVGTLREPTKDATQSGEAEAKIEIGKIPDRDLRNILTDMIVSMDEGTETADAIDTAVNEINYRAGVIEEENPVLIQKDTTLLDMLSVLICGAMRVNNRRSTELKTYASNVAHYLNAGLPDEQNVFVVPARDLADALFSVQHDFAKDANRTLDAELLIRKNKRIDEDRIKPSAEPSWDDIEAEAQALGKDKTNKTDKAKAEQNGEIEPGLLNDIEDGEEGDQ